MLRKALRRVPINNKHVAPEAIAMIIFGHKPFRAETLPWQSVFITSGLGLILEIWMLIYTYLWETMLHSLSVRTQEMTVSSSWPWYIFMLSSRLRAFYGMSFKRLHSFHSMMQPIFMSLLWVRPSGIVKRALDGKTGDQDACHSLTESRLGLCKKELGVASFNEFFHPPWSCCSFVSFFLEV